MSQKLITSFFEKAVPVRQEQVPQMSKDTLDRANEAVNAVESGNSATELRNRKRGSYNRVDSETKHKIAKYAAENGDASAASKFSDGDTMKLSESTVGNWRRLYVNQLKTHPEATTLPSKQRGAPTLLPKECEAKLKLYLEALRGNGGIVNGRIIRAVAIAIVKSMCPHALKTNGGYLRLSRNWAYATATRFGYVKRKATKSTKAEIENADEVCAQFRNEVQNVIKEHKIPPELVINWDETGVHLVPTAHYTYEIEGSKQVMVDSNDDKREITCVLASAMSGDLLKPQLIYQGRTERCHPRTPMPDGWDIWHSESHWATAETCIRYADHVLLPYISSVREKLGDAEQKALVLHDVYKAHQNAAFLSKLEQHNCKVRFVPANMTSALQPNDQLINRVFKTYVMNQYEDFYTAEFMRRLELAKNDPTKVSIDTRLTAIKDKHAQWIVNAFSKTCHRRSVVLKSWQQCGLLAADIAVSDDEVRISSSSSTEELETINVNENSDSD